MSNDNGEVTVRRLIEFTGKVADVEAQVRHSLRDGEHQPGKVHLKIRTVYSEVSGVEGVDPFQRLHPGLGYEEPPLDLTRTDEYNRGLVPNENFMDALKVLRTIRHVCEDKGKGGVAALLRTTLDALRRLALEAEGESD